VRLLLLGCTGFVGRELVPHLLARGHQLVVVSRQLVPLVGLEHPELRRIQADPALAASWQEPALIAAVTEAEGVVNLAGEPIAEKRWSDEQRRRLIDSRLGSTSHLVEALRAHPRANRVLLSGSAVGYYGSSEDARFSESSPAAPDLLGQLCSIFGLASSYLKTSFCGTADLCAAVTKFDFSIACGNNTSHGGIHLFDKALCVSYVFSFDFDLFVYQRDSCLDISTDNVLI
jgi:NAD dependent epimerase/dehydratase family enzyme